MVYVMKVYVDGGCRGNGQPGSIGAAAAVFQFRWGRFKAWTRELPSYPRPTNQRAELTAIIMALELVLEKIEKLNNRPKVRATIYSDSRYAVDCMTKWVDNWRENGWLNSRGVEVANRDLIEEASDFEQTLMWLGQTRLKYQWIPREENTKADEACNDCMDQML